MVDVLIPILIAILAPAVVIFLSSVQAFKFPALQKAYSKNGTKLAEQPDFSTLNCRVQLVQQNNNCGFDAFSVQICGSIHAPSDMHYTVARILIDDITGGVSKVKPVHSCVKRWQLQDLPTFCYNVDLGKLPKRDTTLPDWFSVGQINIDWLKFPRRGKRTLQFSISILSRDSSEQLACATYISDYENPSFGYIDYQENIQRIKAMAVALAFAVSAADKKLFDCEIDIIKKWARTNFDVAEKSNWTKRKLEKAFNRTVRFFREGNQLNAYKICKEIAEIAPIADRYEILELCLHVAQANGVATVEELALLKNFASWLEVDTNRFRSMMEKIIPASMHEIEDVEIVLGVASDMSKDETRRQLNKEYRKWNARVTNSNPEIQTEAEHMLDLITQARSEYVE
jgi:tellurite resistance protein